MIFLFVSRFILYFFVVTLPIIHPGVAVSYDTTGWWLWFVIVPGEMLIGYFLSPPRFRLRTWILSALLPLLILPLFITGFSGQWFVFVLAGSLGFATTALIFRSGGKGRILASLEVFVLAVVPYKMLSFSRASEEIARASTGITQAILLFCILAFLAHGVVLYLAAFRGAAGKGSSRELIVFAAVAVSVVLLVAFLLPPDFVRHSIVFNRLSEPPDPEIVPLDEYGDGRPGGNLRSETAEGDFENGLQGDGQRPQDAEGRGRNRLEGIPSDQWGDSGSGEGSQDRQYAVMVVASAVDPIYAAEAYRGRFDSRLGFQLSLDEPLNDLVFQRLLETWRNTAPSYDLQRRLNDAFFLSTIPDRVLAYEPRAIEPTVYNTIFHPFSYSYLASSAISASGPSQWSRIEGLSAAEEARLSRFLEMPLAPEHRSFFESHLRTIIGEETGYFQRIEAILRSFSVFQYNIGYDEDVSTEKMIEFLSITREGDCTEFSNSAAILGRLAGIPSRVVTGYLSSKGLQTPAHRRGIQALRQAIEPLRAFPEDQLNLVTTAHRHSWTQFYLPAYGWVDFETTGFAIPPVGVGDPSNMNVVIPLIQPQPMPEPAFEFPWLLLAKVVGFLSLAGLLMLYLYRYGRRAALVYRASGRGPQALRSLYKVTLIRLAEEGFKIKTPSQTAAEYSEAYPVLSGFAEKYSRLRYKQTYRPGEQEMLWDDVREASREAIRRSRRKGIWNGIKRIFTLRGIVY